jgi:hypothetical protein
VGFNAAKAIGTLDWDLRPHLDAHGRTPEPSRKAVRRAQETVGEFGDMDESEMSEDQIDEQVGEMVAALEELTQGSPSAAQLRELYDSAPRVFWGFLNWLISELTNPEASRSASTT